MVSCEKETAGEAPLAGPAYADADSAYTAYNNKDYPAAEAKTREAIALRPDVVRLHLLLIDALVAEEKLDEADAAASQALSRFKDDPALLEAQRRVRDQIVYKKKAEALNVAEQGFKEYDEKDYTGAVLDAHRAIELDPLKSSYRVLLVNALIATEDFDEANREVSEGLTKISDDPDLLDRRRAIGEQIAAKEAARIATQAFEAAEAAYKAFAQRDYATAVKEAQEAVNLEPSNSSYRELLEKSEKALKHPVARETVAERYARQGYAASARGDQAQASEDFKAALQRRLPTRIQTRNVQIALADAQLGDGKPQSALDTLEPFGDAAVYDVAVRRGTALQALKRSPEALESFSTAYNTARTPDERASSLSSEVVLLADLGKKNEARARFDQALASGELQTLPPAQIASLALTVGNGEVAAQYYAFTRDTGQLKGRAALDAGYVAMHRAHDKEAIDYFQRAIDAHRAGQLALDPQEVFAIRRQVADLSRTWGAIASLTYSKAGAGPGAPFIPTAGNSLQPGIELYWRPLGYQDGHYVDVFFRAFETAYAQNGASGAKTTQGLVGLRLKPFSQLDLVLEVANAFAMGDLARNDWLLRAAFFYGQGTDLRVDSWTWFTWQFYADYNRFVDSAETIANADLRIGQSVRLDQLNRNLVLFPHVGFFANYDNKLAHAGAYSVGPGATLRYWFREDAYTAPMSYVDLTAQYRFRVGGDQRAEGVFGQVLVNY